MNEERKPCSCLNNSFLTQVHGSNYGSDVAAAGRNMRN